MLPDERAKAASPPHGTWVLILAERLTLLLK
jgi:hypothetical protein